MTESGGVRFSGAEITLVAGMLSVLGGTVAALWFAYSQAQARRIDAQVEQTRRLAQIALAALDLVIRIFDRANGKLITSAEQSELEQLRGRLREPDAPPAPPR